MFKRNKLSPTKLKGLKASKIDSCFRKTTKKLYEYKGICACANVFFFLRYKLFMVFMDFLRVFNFNWKCYTIPKHVLYLRSNKRPFVTKFFVRDKLLLDIQMKIQ